MIDKEKIELKNSIINIFNRFNILDHASTIGGLRDDILKYIDSLQEEPVSEIWHDVTEKPNTKRFVVLTKDGIITTAFIPLKMSFGELAERARIKKWAYASDLLNLSNVERTIKNWKEPVSDDLEQAAEEYKEKSRIDAVVSRKRDFINGAKWQKEQDKETIELAEDHAMLAGMEKMKEKMMKNLWKPANGDDLPKIDREVIALLNNGKVVFAHRLYKRKYIGKNLITGNIKTFENEAYGEGGWNMPDIKWWLDVELPKEIEL